MPTIDLLDLADRLRGWCESMRVADAPYGTYRFSDSRGPTFYAAADMAILRWATGEELTETVSEDDRRQWASVINSYQSANGHYGPEMNHHVLHANGTAVNALCILGQRHQHQVGFYDLFRTAERIGPWLTQINWQNRWPASHLVWGGPVVWASSSQATSEWRAACLRWFAEQLDDYGSWPKDFAGTVGGEIGPLGCAVHVWPLYRHFGVEVPGLERLADWVLHWQQPEGHWDQAGAGGYGTMDALYVLCVAVEQDLPNAAKYRAAAERYFTSHFALLDQPWSTFHVHFVLGWTSCVAYLRRILPDQFVGDVRWGDIFDMKEIYDLDAVAAPAELVSALDGHGI